MSNTSGHVCHRDFRIPQTYTIRLSDVICVTQIVQSNSLLWFNMLMIFWLPHKITRYIKLNWQHCWTICRNEDTDAAFKKPNLLKNQVTFLGQTIGTGNRSITQDRAASVQAIPLPTTIKTLRSFLGTAASNDLKRALCQAPALRIAQSDRPFVLYVHVHLGLMTACLMQDHGGSLRPIRYYSGKLNIVV